MARPRGEDTDVVQWEVTKGKVGSSYKCASGHIPNSVILGQAGRVAGGCASKPRVVSMA